MPQIRSRRKTNSGHEKQVFVSKNNFCSQKYVSLQKIQILSRKTFLSQESYFYYEKRFFVSKTNFCVEKWFSASNTQTLVS